VVVGGTKINTQDYGIPPGFNSIKYILIILFFR
jgi:hypothetical protein